MYVDMSFSIARNNLAYFCEQEKRFSMFSEVHFNWNAWFMAANLEETQVLFGSHPRLVRTLTLSTLASHTLAQFG
jgi:hypothetical protein